MTVPVPAIPGVHSGVIPSQLPVAVDYPAPLDYFNMMDAGDAAAVKKGYLSCLHRAGLSCSEHNLSLLTQALYPVDATAENMKVLAGNCTELAAMKVPGGLTIFIVGQNCD